MYVTYIMTYILVMVSGKESMGYCLCCNKPLGHSKPHYGQHIECFEAIFHVSGTVEFDSLVRKSSTSDAAKEETTFRSSPHLTSYFGGNYRKYEGTLGEAKYILKLSNTEYPELSPVEFVCNKIAHHCKIVVPTPFTLIDVGKGELAFVSQNFMDNYRHHATLNHIYHYLKPGSKHYNVEEISNAIYRETNSAADVEMFFRMLLFDALIGNHDRHGRNLAFIETSSGRRLTPIYDNPSSLGLESGNILKATFAPKGKIWTRDSREPEMTEYLDELKRLDVTQIARSFYEALSFDKIQGYISESRSLSKEMMFALTKLVSTRFGDLKSYVEKR